MSCQNPDCLGQYDFDSICDTVALLEQAESEREKEEIALVSLLDVEDDQILNLKLSCKHAGQCKVLDCRDRLKKLIQDELAIR